jgi:hypothetical protein
LRPKLERGCLDLSFGNEAEELIVLII